MSLATNPKIREKLLKRVLNDIKQLMECKDFSAVFPDPANTNVIWVKFRNQMGLYSNQTHVIEIKLRIGESHDYPVTPPHVKFLTSILHVNVKNGSICLSILKGVNEKDGWTPSCNLCGVVQAIFLLLEFPNILSPFNVDAVDITKRYDKDKNEAAYKEVIDEYYNKSNNIKTIEAFDAIANAEQ